MLYPDDYAALEGLRLRQTRGEGSVTVEKVHLRGAKTPILTQELGETVGKDNPVLDIPLDIDKSGPRKYIYLDIFIRAEHEQEDSDVIVELLRR